MFASRCAYCGCKITYDRFEVDHVYSSVEFHALQFAQAEIFSVQDGSVIDRYNDIQNLFPSCIQCNRIKKEKSIEDFRKYLSQLRDSLIQKQPKLRILFNMGILPLSQNPIIFHFEKVPSNRH